MKSWKFARAWERWKESFLTNGNLSTSLSSSSSFPFFFPVFRFYALRFYFANQMRLFSFITLRSRIARKVKRVPQQMMVNLLNIFIGIARNESWVITIFLPRTFSPFIFFPRLCFSDDERATLPPEMYINQQKWLELRATRKSLISCLCNNVSIVSWTTLNFRRHLKSFYRKRECSALHFILFVFSSISLFCFLML